MVVPLGPRVRTVLGLLQEARSRRREFQSRLDRNHNVAVMVVMAVVVIIGGIAVYSSPCHCVEVQKEET